jgi:hypothetical protein
MRGYIHVINPLETCLDFFGNRFELNGYCVHKDTVMVKVKAEA